MNVMTSKECIEKARVLRILTHPTWIAILSFVMLLSLLIHTKSNVPIFDDFPAVLKIFSGREIANLDTLLKPHNEHLIYLVRTFIIMDYSIFGNVNFVRLSVYGLLGLIPISLAIFSIVRNNIGGGLILAAASAALIFRPEHWKFLLYPMANIEAIWVVSFGLWAIICADKDKIVLSTLLCFLSVISNSSGLLIPFAIFFQFLLRGKYNFSLLFLFFSFCLYFSYKFMGGGSDEIFRNLMNYPFESVTFFLGVLGSSLSSLLPASFGVSVSIGIFVLGALAYFILPSLRVRSLEVAIVLFCVGSCALVGAARGHLYYDKFTEYTVDGRYRIYSLVLTALLFSFLFKRAKEIVTIVAAVVLIAMSYYANAGQWVHYNAVLTDRFKSHIATPELSKLNITPLEDERLKKAIADGVIRVD